MPHEPERRWVDAMAEAYERWLVPTVFGPFAVDLASRVAAHCPRSILELAAGTGVLTRQLLVDVPDTQVTATDLNTSMVEEGRRRAPGARWRQADAMALPFADGEFDAVVCQFGAMFFPDKARAFAEARRVMATSGRFLLTTWGDLTAHAFECALVDSLVAVFPESPPRFIASVPHGYSDPAVVLADLGTGGFERVAYEQLIVTGRAQSLDAVVTGYCAGTPLRAELEERTDLDRAIEAVAVEMRRRMGPDPVSATMSAYVFEATT